MNQHEITMESAMHLHADILKESYELRHSITRFDRFMATAKYKKYLGIRLELMEAKTVIDDYAFGMFPQALEDEIFNVLNK